MSTKSVDNIKQWVVLLIDDDLDNIGVAKKILTFYGATVHVANNGQQGLDMLQTLVPTIILCDLSMPIMDGWEFLKTVKADPNFKHLSVVALTAHAMQGDEQQVRAAGFVNYIAKPFTIATFLHEVRKVVLSIPPQPL
jgi:two-component system, cell cycle response regulator DivK